MRSTAIVILSSLAFFACSAKPAPGTIKESDLNLQQMNAGSTSSAGAGTAPLRKKRRR